MQIQRRLAMRVIELGLDPKLPCTLDKHGNLRQKKNISTESVFQPAVVKNINDQKIDKPPTVSVQIQQNILETKEEIETNENETVQVEEVSQTVAKPIKSKFSKKK